MFDLDHSKLINDRFGHATGDAALRAFADVLRTSMRANDLVCRFAGEEFAAIVPGDVSVAQIIGERVRAAFENAGATIERHPVGGTVSIGAATEHVPCASLDALIGRADAALYEAKNQGRNRLRVVALADSIDYVPFVPVQPVREPECVHLI